MCNNRQPICSRPICLPDPFLCTCSFKDKEVQRDAKMVSYDVVDKKGKPNVQVEIGGEKKTFSPEEISAMILGKMKETAGAQLSQCILLSTVLCPAKTVCSCWPGAVFQSGLAVALCCLRVLIQSIVGHGLLFDMQRHTWASL